MSGKMKRPKEGTKYWYLIFHADSTIDVDGDYDQRYESDDDCWRTGNYFLTKKAATLALREIKKVLKNSPKQ